MKRVFSISALFCLSLIASQANASLDQDYLSIRSSLSNRISMLQSQVTKVRASTTICYQAIPKLPIVLTSSSLDSCRPLGTGNLASERQRMNSCFDEKTRALVSSEDKFTAVMTEHYVCKNAVRVYDSWSTAWQSAWTAGTTAQTLAKEIRQCVFDAAKLAGSLPSSAMAVASKLRSIASARLETLSSLETFKNDCKQTVSSAKQLVAASTQTASNVTTAVSTTSSAATSTATDAFLNTTMGKEVSACINNKECWALGKRVLNTALESGGFIRVSGEVRGDITIDGVFFKGGISIEAKLIRLAKIPNGLSDDAYEISGKLRAIGGAGLGTTEANATADLAASMDFTISIRNNADLRDFFYFMKVIGRKSALSSLLGPLGIAVIYVGRLDEVLFGAVDYKRLLRTARLVKSIGSDICLSVSASGDIKGLFKSQAPSVNASLASCFRMAYERNLNKPSTTKANLALSIYSSFEGSLSIKPIEDAIDKGLQELIVATRTVGQQHFETFKADYLKGGLRTKLKLSINLVAKECIDPFSVRGAIMGPFLSCLTPDKKFTFGVSVEGLIGIGPRAIGYSFSLMSKEFTGNAMIKALIKRPHIDSIFQVLNEARGPIQYWGESRIPVVDGKLGAGSSLSGSIRADYGIGNLCEGTLVRKFPEKIRSENGVCYKERLIKLLMPSASSVGSLTGATNGVVKWVIGTAGLSATSKVIAVAR